ncbi:hybrid sensor histidine kinase/response regulator [Aliikangiella sp. IMCC44359]|uniref:hybrid sensor histidine kinase/response regulator n=1 Tax=Aliikangiella sp. IMCC44359 TaxID=3459125 RepID=UPI00403AA2CC
MFKILVIEDNADHFALIENTLLTAFKEGVKLYHAIKLAQGIETLEQQPFDICLCDLKYPDSPLDKTVEKLKQLNSSVPIIILTSLNSIEIAQDLLQHDIQDYLPKEELSPTLLYRICMHAIERKQQQLALEKRNEEMQTFCASLSHDFKGYLRRIPQIATLLRRDLSEHTTLSSKDLERFSMLENSTSAIRDLVDSLGKFLLIGHEETKSEPIDLSALFKKLETLIINTNEDNIQLKLDVANNLPTVIGNMSQLIILFHNLISNGIKYNKNSPSIHITSSIDKNQKQCKILVKDNGIGIEKLYFQQIFSPFRRLHNNHEYKGTGLGLSIVKRIIELHKGHIDIESEPGKGSTFIVYLPLYNSP